MPAPKQKAAEVKKAEADRLQGFLQEMLREEENKYCADCESKQPRWASWNLGVFLCIRCAGLHRNLGVHISKVKSVTLDSWTPEQIQSMRVMGNAKARAVYECELPSVFRRPQTDQSLEQFIRAKYESKRYLMKGWIQPRIDINDLPALPETMIRDKKAAALATNNHLKRSSVIITESSNSKIQQPSPPTIEKAIVSELINFDFSMPTHREDSSNTNANQQTDITTIGDLFGPIVTATPPLQQQPIPTSLSVQNITTNINNFLSLTNNDNDTQKQMNPTTTMLNQPQYGISEHFDTSNFTSITNASNPLQSTDSDLLGLDLSLCTINSPSGTRIRKSQSSSTVLDLPPASDIKKSTNEILALFKK